MFFTSLKQTNQPEFLFLEKITEEWGHKKRGGGRGEGETEWGLRIGKESCTIDLLENNYLMALHKILNNYHLIKGIQNNL